jgi:hypothetical protein
MRTLPDKTLAARIVPHKRRAVGAIVVGGLRACSRVRDLLRKRVTPRNPVIRLDPRRVARLSPCGGWFVIMPLQESPRKLSRHVTPPEWAD